MTADAISFTVRNLPKPLHAALTKLAAANRRSINAEVVMAIEGHIAKAEKSKCTLDKSCRKHPYIDGGGPTKRAKRER